MTGITGTLWVGITSGVLSGLLVLILFWLRQRIIDRFGILAFKAIFCCSQNSTLKDRWEVRGRIFNNTSMQVYAYPTLLDLEGQTIEGHGGPIDAWTGEELKGYIPVAPKSWCEFRIQNMRRGSQTVPLHIKLNFFYFTLKKATDRIYKVERCQEPNSI
jgi:hypothetical protein